MMMAALMQIVCFLIVVPVAFTHTASVAHESRHLAVVSSSGSTIMREGHHAANTVAEGAKSYGSKIMRRDRSIHSSLFRRSKKDISMAADGQVQADVTTDVLAQVAETMFSKEGYAQWHKIGKANHANIHVLFVANAGTELMQAYDVMTVLANTPGYRVSFMGYKGKVKDVRSLKQSGVQLLPNPFTELAQSPALAKALMVWELAHVNKNGPIDFMVLDDWRSFIDLDDKGMPTLLGGAGEKRFAENPFPLVSSGIPTFLWAGAPLTAQLAWPQLYDGNLLGLSLKLRTCLSNRTTTGLSEEECYTAVLALDKSNNFKPLNSLALSANFYEDHRVAGKIFYKNPFPTFVVDSHGDGNIVWRSVHSEHRGVMDFRAVRTTVVTASKPAVNVPEQDKEKVTELKQRMLRTSLSKGPITLVYAAFGAQSPRMDFEALKSLIGDMLAAASIAPYYVLVVLPNVLPGEEELTQEEAKHKLENAFSSRKNVQFETWFPQSTLFAEFGARTPSNTVENIQIGGGHKMIFVSHGGTNSLSEAMSRNIPIVCIPANLEMAHCCRHMAQVGVGVNLSEFSYMKLLKPHKWVDRYPVVRNYFIDDSSASPAQEENLVEALKYVQENYDSLKNRSVEVHKAAKRSAVSTDQVGEKLANIIEFYTGTELSSGNVAVNEDIQQILDALQVKNVSEYLGKVKDAYPILQEIALNKDYMKDKHAGSGYSSPGSGKSDSNDNDESMW